MTTLRGLHVPLPLLHSVAAARGARTTTPAESLNATDASGNSGGAVGRQEE